MKGHTMKVKLSKLTAGTLGLALALTLTTASAQSQPSAKATARTANLTILPKTTGTNLWQTVLAANIKTANQKDLFISASFEVGLYTQTQVSSKNMTKDTSTADAAVQVRVLLDGNVVEPGNVVFGRRSQTLSATLEGAIAGCLTIATNADGTLSIILDPTCVTPETIELILDTMNAATFNFVATDVPQGVHTISIQARVNTATAVQTGTASALGTIGKGSMTVESVRLIKGDNVVVEIP
jgi:hypothetical protein